MKLCAFPLRTCQWKLYEFTAYKDQNGGKAETQPTHTKRPLRSEY